MRAALYARVSTTDQDCAMQVRELEAWAARSQADVRETVRDTSSGAKARRPGLDRVLEMARRRQIDAVVVWKIDRFARSVLDLLMLVEELGRCGVRLISTTQGIDTDQSSATGRLFLHLLAAFAEFERELIRERSVAGQRRYRDEFARGKAHSRSGKNLPVGRQKRVFDRLRAGELRQAGWSWARIAKQVGAPEATVRRAVLAKVLR